ncbi:MAG: Rod shape-determining protein MreC [Ignavibacteriae bacterium]|nr:MAG: Rod shape-determining protein MreC [Ignavibacteriota bacterium]
MIGFAQNTAKILPNIIDLKRENEILHQMNVTLMDEVSKLKEAKLENIRLRQLLKFKEESKYSLVAADVIGKTLHLQKNTLTLNVGSKDGIDINMPIVSPQGIVGKIIAVSSDYSVGQLLYNRDFRTSVKIQRSRVDGILAWDGGEFLIIKNISKKQDVEIGDVVITSEYSNVFPPGLKVGTVVSATENPLNLFKNIYVKPAVDFTILEEVFIINAVIDTQKVSLEKKVLSKK